MSVDLIVMIRQKFPKDIQDHLISELIEPKFCLVLVKETWDITQENQIPDNFSDPQ